MSAKSRLAGSLMIAAVVAGGAACNAVMGLDDFDMTYDAGAGGQAGAGSAGGGGGGGGGGGAECATADDCRRENACELAFCVEGRCDRHRLRDMPGPDQTAGDCTEIWCNEAGQPEPRLDAGDVVDDMNECTYDLCESMTSVVHPPRPRGASCSQGLGTKCDGIGVCVELCDYSGQCGDSMSGCIACALEGDCADELAACSNDSDCNAYVSCIDPCTDQACTAQCATDHPTGEMLYNNLEVCTVCVQCSVDCADSPSPNCP